MVNKTLDAITKQLGDKFGAGYHYYVEDVEQKLKTPCFTVNVLNPLSRSINYNTYYRTIPCVIHYFASNGNVPKKDCYAIGDSALECLEYITVENRLVRGEDMSYTMVDDVLEIFITYRFWTNVPKAVEDGMGDIEIAQPSVIN